MANAALRDRFLSRHKTCYQCTEEKWRFCAFGALSHLRMSLCKHPIRSRAPTRNSQEHMPVIQYKVEAALMADNRKVYLRLMLLK
jgi:hypothetical protein